MKLWLTVCCCVLMAAVYAETRICRLSEFGPVGTAGEAKAAAEKAAAALKTGGILVVDDAVAAAFMPESVPQGRLGEPGVSSSICGGENCGWFRLRWASASRRIRTAIRRSCWTGRSIRER